MVAGQPFQEAGGGVDLLRLDPLGRILLQGRGDAPAPLLHLGPVLDGVADVAEH